MSIRRHSAVVVFLLFAWMLLYSCSDSSSTTSQGDEDNSGDGDSTTVDGDGSPTDGDKQGDTDIPPGDTDEQPIDGDSDLDIDPATDGDQEPDVTVECKQRCLNVKDEVDFGSVPPGQCKYVDLVIESSGSMAVLVIEVSLTGETSEEFQIESFTPENMTPPVDLSPRHTMTVKLQYCPADMNEDEGTLIIASNDEVRPRREVKLKMTWKGTTNMTLEPSELTFEEQNISDNLTLKEYTISAVPDGLDSTRPLEVKSITMVDAENPNFSLPLPQYTCETPFYLSVGESRVCPIAFHPTDVGDYNTTVTVVASDYVQADQSDTVQVSGTGVSPAIEIDPTSIDFGFVLYERASVSRNVTVTNTGSGLLQVSDISWITNSNESFSFEDPNGLLTTPIAEGNSETFLIRYDPTIEAIDIGTLRIRSNDPNQSVTTLTANGFGTLECPPGMQPASPSSAQCEPNCDPGAIICWYEGGVGYRICGDDGRSLGEFIECPIPGQLCIEEECQDQPCTPNAMRCLDDTHQQQCKTDGSGWLAPVECVSQRACKVNECRDSQCRDYDAEEGSECSDGSVCTENDTCNANGVCIGEEVFCDDDNDCTDDRCSENSGCINEPNDRNSCNDNNPCTNNDHCLNGECVGDSLYDCEDNNPCTDDLCDPEADPPCTHIPNDDNDCTDWDVCTIGEHCSNGECVPGDDTLDCEDDNQCTSDICSPTTGCIHNPVSGDCNDFDDCTKNDHCQYDGFSYGCFGTSYTCTSTQACKTATCDGMGGCDQIPVENGTECNDNNVCTQNDSCQAGQCLGEEDPDYCDDDKICTTDYCHPTYGCQHSNNTLDCEDGNPCTLDDQCSGGICEPGNEDTCYDGNDCTLDECDPDNGGCVQGVFEPDGTDCDDGDPCTSDDQCNNGVCEGSGDFECPPSTNPCKTATCDAQNGCQYVNLPNYEFCDNGNYCTENDYCFSGVCQPGNTVTCPDEPVDDMHLVCRNYNCDSSQGCTYTTVNNLCNDNDACTENDACQNGYCIPGTTKTCPDVYVDPKHLPCRSYSCDPINGCTYENVAGSCSDGYNCTTDVCQGGLCVSTPNNDFCNDSNICSTDTCSPGSSSSNADGCRYTVSGEACDDGDACTQNDFCNSAMVCQGGQAITCSVTTYCEQTGCATTCTEYDRCDAVQGCLFKAKTGGSCSDGNSCTTDACEGMFCVSDTRDCNDSNVCTVDDCDSAQGGCIYDELNSSMPSGPFYGLGDCPDDNNVCTVDACVNGNCTNWELNSTVPGGPLYYGYDEDHTCPDDNNVCTLDVCVGGACTHTALNSTVPSGPLYGQGDCPDDDNECTLDVCINGNCTNWDNSGGSCDDDDPCTINDTCSGGTCAGTPKNCDFGSECKTYWCDETSGDCMAGNVEDGTSCSAAGFIGGACESGVCVGYNTFPTPGPCPGHSDMRKMVGTDSCIDTYEATVCRSDSCSSNCRGQNSNDYWICFWDDGNDNTCTGTKPRACSIADSVPSRWITFDQAKKACERAGKHVCSPTDWVIGCKQDEASRSYPYGYSYEAQTCNGDDYSGSGIQPTGYLSECVNDWGVYDMSGNAYEWTDDGNYGDPDQRRYGGSYGSSSSNLTCDWYYESNWDTTESYIGFRCCLDMAGK